ncbi:MAG: hypothetical protein AAGA57_05990 [Planctomycetota bacterium]
MLIGLLLGPWLVACATDPSLPVEYGVPDACWVDSTFRWIDPMAEKAGWPNLREQPPEHQAGDEVRVWIGFALRPWQAVRMARGPQGATVERFGGMYPLHSVNDADGDAAVRSESEHVAESLWRDFDRLDIATLPDGRLLNDPTVRDGVSYLFEVYQDGRYRALKYSNPDASRAWQARRVQRFIRSLEDHLGLEGL